MATIQSLDFSANIELARFRRALQKTRRGIKRTSEQITKDIRRIGAVASAVFASMSILSLKFFADYETGFAQIASRTGYTLNQVLTNYQAGVKRISLATGELSRLVQDAIQRSISAGVGGSAALDLVGQSAKFTAAGLGDMNSAVSTATTLVIAFRDANVDGRDALDAITRAAQVGEGDVTDYAIAIKQGAALAATLGVRLEELGGGIAAISRVAASVSLGGTQFRRFLQQIIKPTERARETLSGLGLDIEILRNRIKREGFLPVYEDIYNSLINNTDALGKIFDSVEAQAFLLNVRPDAFRELTAEVAEGIGKTTDVAFGVAEKTLERRFNKLTQFVRFKFSDIGRYLNDTLVSDGAISTIEDVISTIAVLLTRFAEGFVYVTKQIFRFRREIGFAIKAWIAYKTAIFAANIGKLFFGLAAAIKAVAVSLLTFSKAALLANFSTALFAALTVGAIAAFQIYAKFADELAPLFKSLVEVISNSLKIATTVFKGFFSFIRVNVVHVFNLLRNDLSKLFANVEIRFSKLMVSLISAYRDSFGKFLSRDQLADIQGNLDKLRANITKETANLGTLALEGTRLSAARPRELSSEERAQATARITKLQIEDEGRKSELKVLRQLRTDIAAQIIEANSKNAELTDSEVTALEQLGAQLRTLDESIFGLIRSNVDSLTAQTHEQSRLDAGSAFEGLNAAANLRSEERSAALQSLVENWDMLGESLTVLSESGIVGRMGEEIVALKDKVIGFVDGVFDLQFPELQGEPDDEPIGGKRQPVTPQEGDGPAEVTQGTIFARDLVVGIGNDLKTAFLKADFDDLGDIFINTLHTTLVDTAAKNLSKLFKDVFANLFGEGDGFLSGLSGLLGAGAGGGAPAGAGASGGGIGALPRFHGGGRVPGRAGAEVPILAEAGELVLDEQQQQSLEDRLLGSGDSYSIAFNVTGDVTQATHRAIRESAREVSEIVYSQFQERRLLA